MSINAHGENRTWAFQALDEMQAFLNDPDFEGDAADESAQVERKRRELQDNKYRVVILGAFNVGKSALINAFLGDEYLPMVLEECTTKITHVVKADSMSTLLKLSTPAPPEEKEALSNLIEALNVGAAVSEEPGTNHLIITYKSNEARDLLKSLRPLVTVSADQDFPHLKPLRSRFDEIFIRLPTDLLEEDIALVDSPGVHSISETNMKIAQEIIPTSHLVCCLLDSQYAGTAQNREFIESVIKHKHRKLFFVINKSDQLNRAEIDPRGHRGPARDLMRSLGGIVDNPEIFFVSSLYALISQQLFDNKIGLTDLDENNKIKIPFAIQRQLLESENPGQDLADYLLKQSNIAALKTRLLEYLYKENREGAIVESVCRFLDGRTFAYTRPLQVKLELARDVPRLDQLQLERERLTRELDETLATSERVLESFNAMATGTKVNDTEFKGYEALVDGLINEKAVKEQVLEPLGAWLRNNANFSKARKDSFALLKNEIESRIDAVLRNAYSIVNAEVDAIENAALNQAGQLHRDVGANDRGYIEAARGRVGAIKAGLGGSYFGFMVFGAAVLGGIGAAAGNAGAAGPDVDLVIGAGAGAVLGAVLGLILRALSGKGAVRKKLDKIITEKVNQILLEVSNEKGAAQVAPVREQLKERLAKRRDAFGEAIQFAFGKEAGRLNMEIETVVGEEEALKAKQREIIDRIEPKLERLLAMGQRASEIAKANAPVEEITFEAQP